MEKKGASEKSNSKTVTLVDVYNLSLTIIIIIITIEKKVQYFIHFILNF
jgi:hypothetical protein